MIRANGNHSNRAWGSALAKAVAAVALAACALAPSTAEAQPFGAFLTLNGPAQHGYIRVPHSAALNPAAITIEAWVNFSAPGGGEDCRSIIGKNYLQAWWVGRCNGQIRAYFRGGSSARTGGVIPSNQTTHIAVTFDGVRQKHYVNGELVLDQPAGGAAGVSGSEVRIGSDVSWQFTPQGSMDEIRLWNVARTLEQIRSTINVTVGATPGLVARWALNGNGQDSIGPHDGTVQGVGAAFLSLPVTLVPCTRTATAHCFFDRFAVTAKFRTGAPGTAEGTAQTVNVANSGSGLFWFFNDQNWEIQAKAINGCGLNNRWWFFSAATTNVFYRLEVLDRHAGANKIYFNYQGPPAPAVTDTNAFATCP